MRKLLAGIFAYSVQPETLSENILFFPIEFLADVLLANMKRLPFRLNEEEAADLDKSADKYHLCDSLSSPDDRNQNTSEDVEARGTTSNGKRNKKEKGSIKYHQINV